MNNICIDIKPILKTECDIDLRNSIHSIRFDNQLNVRAVTENGDVFYWGTIDEYDIKNNIIITSLGIEIKIKKEYFTK